MARRLDKMSFRDGTGRVVTIHIPHGTGVMLSKRGGGVSDKSIEHKVEDGGKSSFFLALEMTLKKST